MRFSKKERDLLRAADLEDKITNLTQWYTPIDLNPDYHNSKIKSVRKLDAILELASRQELQMASNINEVLLCALTLIYYFGMRFELSTTSKRFSRWFSKRHFLKAETIFKKTMDRLLPERSEATITIMLTFFTDVTLWPVESIVEQVLRVALYFTRQETTVIDMLLTNIHDELIRNVIGARHRLKILYKLLNSEHCYIERPTLLLPIVTRLLEYYTKLLLDSDSNLTKTYIKSGFQICLRRIIEKASNNQRLLMIITVLDWFSSREIKDHKLLECALLLECAVQFYKVGSFTESLSDDLLNLILNSFVCSTDPLYSLIGLRLFLQLADRQHNAFYIIEPRIYYEVSKSTIKFGIATDNDRVFMEHHREKFYECFIRTMKEHCEHISNLKALCAVVCCMILEVPCAVTAAAAAGTMMAMQDHALNGDNISPRCRYWMHSIVVSVMSLLSWVHKMPVLCKYIDEVIFRRAREAPHLNPPLKKEYDATRPNAINATTLFVQDWEIKYGLWKTFSLQPGSYLDLRR